MTITISNREKSKKKLHTECQLICTYSWIFCTMATQICVNRRIGIGVGIEIEIEIEIKIVYVTCWNSITDGMMMKIAADMHIEYTYTYNKFTHRHTTTHIQTHRKMLKNRNENRRVAIQRNKKTKFNIQHCWPKQITWSHLNDNISNCHIPFRQQLEISSWILWFFSNYTNNCCSKLNGIWIKQQQQQQQKQIVDW